MNEHFVNIKIDREERPDVDHIYMDAVQAMTGSGGWPLNVFLTPDGKPFYGGTYFPPRRAFQPRFLDRSIGRLLPNLGREGSEKMCRQPKLLHRHIQQSNAFGPSSRMTTAI